MSFAPNNDQCLTEKDLINQLTKNYAKRGMGPHHAMAHSFDNSEILKKADLKTIDLSQAKSVFNSHYG